MKIEKMVEEINKAVTGTLSIAHYTMWELYSYGNHSLFSRSKGTILAKSFKELIERAYIEYLKRRVR